MYKLNAIVAKFTTPKLLIPYDIASYIQVMTQKVEIEYTFFCGVSKINDHTFIVDNIYVPSQRCSGVTTEVTEEGEAEVMMHFQTPPKLWGHSHVDMGVTPSGQDHTMIQKFVDLEPEGNQWYIMMIVNKRNDITLRYKTKNFECDMEPQVTFESAADIEEALKRISKMTYTTWNSANSTASSIGFKSQSQVEGNDKLKNPSQESKPWNAKSLELTDTRGEREWQKDYNKKSREKKSTKVNHIKVADEKKDLMTKLYKDVLSYKDGIISDACTTILSEDDISELNDIFNSEFNIWHDDFKYWTRQLDYDPEQISKFLPTEKEFIEDTFDKLSKRIVDITGRPLSQIYKSTTNTSKIA